MSEWEGETTTLTLAAIETLLSKLNSEEFVVNLVIYKYCLGSM